MPIKLHELAAKTRALTITYDGGELAFCYYPAHFTPLVAARFNAIPQADAPFQEMVEALASILASWEILDEKGKPLPASVEWIEQMPLDLLNLIGEAIGHDMRPKGTNGTPSAAI
jgi:hypothetical protein